jgi:hypothetical protein
MEKLARRILEVARWPQGEEKTAEARKLKARVRRWLQVERERALSPRPCGSS